MRTLAILITLFVATFISRGQPAPTLTHTVGNGQLTLTWPVHIITNTTTNLHASYQLEIAGELGAWTPHGPILRGASFPSRVATTRLTNSLDRAQSFFRMRAILDFAGANLSRATLRDAPLTNGLFTGANFFAALLDGTVFDNANLTAGDFRFASMTFVSARDADLTLARLSDADLNSADLRGSRLILAELSGATLNFADLRGADLRGAILQDMQSVFTRFHETKTDDTTIFDRRTFAIWLIVSGFGHNRTFDDVDLTFADLSGGNLVNSSLARLDLSGVDFSNADLRGANLTNTNLRLVDLRGAKIDQTTIIPGKWLVIWDIINNPRAERSHANADLSLAFWVGTTFERADIRGANFNLGLMTDMNFESANAVGARFTTVDCARANFRNANLRNALFNNAILEDVDFRGADTTGANFLGATMRNVTMPDGTIRNQ